MGCTVEKTENQINNRRWKGDENSHLVFVGGGVGREASVWKNKRIGMADYETLKLQTDN